MSYIGQKPTDKPLSASDLEDGLITNAKLAQDIISAETELATAPADTDELLISDAGVLKRIDASLIGGGGIQVAQQFRLASDQSGSGSNGTVFTNYEENDTDYQAIGSAFSQSSGIFSCSSTGVYLCNWTVVITSTSADDAYDPNVQISTDSGSNYNTRSRAWGQTNTTVPNGSVTSSFVFDVANSSNFRLRFRQSADNDIGTNATIKGSSSENYTQISFVRLGDT